MIVIEGPDRVGKTTLTKALLSRLDGWKEVHFGIPPVPVFEYHMEGLIAAGPRSIVDRLHWSEYAYGLTYRGRNGYDQLAWAAVEEFLVSCKATVILMTDANKQIRSRWTKDEPFDPDRIEELAGHFDDLASGVSDPKSLFANGCLVWNLRDLFSPDGSERSHEIRSIVDDERGKF